MRALKVLLAVLLLASLGAAQTRPERNSFLNKRITTKAQLMSQVRNDPLVADRFMRHFGMTREELITYMDSLRLGRLRRSGTYSVYSVPEGGMLKVHDEKLKQGEPVFEDESGNPILLVKCGNPLTMGPAQPLSDNEIAPLITQTPTLALRELPQVEFSPTEELVALNALPPGVPVLPELPPTTAIIPPTTTEPTSRPEIISRPGFNPLPLLALGGLLAFGGGGGGGGGMPPVPEPASVLVVGFGVAALISRRFRSAR